MERTDVPAKRTNGWNAAGAALHYPGTAEVRSMPKATPKNYCFSWAVTLFGGRYDSRTAQFD